MDVASSKFFTEYANLRDEELLQVASDRASLTDEAALALDAEMQKRRLTYADLMKHEQFVNRATQREKKQRLRRAFGRKQDWDSWVDVFWALLPIAVVVGAYLSLPKQYRFSPSWEPSAEIVLFTVVFLLAGIRLWPRRIAFFISLLVSCGIQALLVHMWVLRFGKLGRGTGRWAVLLGWVLFVAVYGCGFQLRRKFYGDDADPDQPPE